MYAHAYVTKTEFYFTSLFSFFFHKNILMNLKKFAFHLTCSAFNQTIAERLLSFELYSCIAVATRFFAFEFAYVPQRDNSRCDEIICNVIEKCEYRRVFLEL